VVVQVDMSRYYDRGGGCFSASTTVTVFPSSVEGEEESKKGAQVVAEQVKQVAVGCLKGGASVLAFRLSASGRLTFGAAVVGAVVETVRDNHQRDGDGAAHEAAAASAAAAKGPLLVTLPSGAEVTPWHPVVDIRASPAHASGLSRGLSGGLRGGLGGGVGEEAEAGTWAFPAALACGAGCVVDDDLASPSACLFRAAHRPEVASVFNLALLPPCGGGGGGSCGGDESAGPWHGVVLNGSCCAITLGHGIAGDPVASHPYYGSALVLDDLARLARRGSGSSSGHGHNGRVVVSAADHSRAAAASVAFVAAAAVAAAAPGGGFRAAAAAAVVSA
jgi:hypothetical protein